MTAPHPSRPQPNLSWGIGALLASGFLALVFVPPFVDGFARGGIMQAFSFVCHQIPERSPHIAGSPLALCHRCTGIFAGFALGLAVGPLAVPAFVRGVKRVFARVAPRHRAASIFVASGVPTLIDWTLGASGLWRNTPVSRIATGLLFGLVAGLLVARGLLQPPRTVSTSSPTLT